MKFKILVISLIAILLVSGGAFIWRQTHVDLVKEQQKAQETLVNFFDAVAAKQYETAVKIFYPLDENGKYNWSGIMQYSDPQKQSASKADELAYYCFAVGTCLKTEVLSSVQKSTGEYLFTVQFKNEDGSIFLYGPFGGVTEKESPSQTQFIFEVHKVYGKYKVVTSPLYRP